MESVEVLDRLSELFWVTAKVAAPILISALLVGLLISIFQVVTQIQEMTLTFVPKLIIVLLVIASFSTFLLDVIQSYSISNIMRIAEL